ncbi:dTDP-4-amino-4,6-dideoxygalactose transaminase [Pasteurellaceae bacterium RH1A]|nr:dTDP-4-amino-4,6-dideoxygalactose transaminase [Pasteurellaceae bacterium RH1A]
MIPFNQPPLVGTELEHLQAAMASGQLAGNGAYTQRCEAWLEAHLGVKKALLTPSCTAALEMAALLLHIQPGDEVIMPSYTFVSTANAFALRGAKIVFVDIKPNSLNLDENLVEAAITPRTKAIVVVHYAGVSCEMAAIMALAQRYGLSVVEDAAQALGATYQGRPLGSIGHIGCLSFHETKNISAGGEGGALLLNVENFIEPAEIIREKGTNRSQFFRKQVDKYRWQALGSSYLMSELQAAYLYAQLQALDQIQTRRQAIYLQYLAAFQPLADQGLVELPQDMANAHIFYLKLADLAQRTALIEHLKAQGILAVFHYIPLHTSPAGQALGRFHGQDNVTTRESERLVRLPLFYNMADEQVARVIEAVGDFFRV